MTREKMIDALHERSPLFVSRETFARALDGWQINEVKIDGRAAFITAVRGPEFHFSDLGTGRPISRKMIREFLKPIIAEHGYAMTKTPKDDVRQRRFNEKYGFHATACDSEYVTYSIRWVN